MTAMTNPEHDVVIVGSGAGGGAAAWALCNHKIRVLVLEAGPAYDPLQDYRLERNDWEQTGFPFKPGSRGKQTFAPLQELEERWKGLRSWNRRSGHLVPGNRRIASAYHHVRGVGGSTLHFTGEAHRLHPDAMKMHSRFGVAADWPFDYDELEPYYCTAERLIGVAGPPADRVRMRSEPYPLPPHKMSYASQQLREGCRKLGLHWEANPVAALSAPYDGRPPCNYCANCNRGCPRLDKGSADITFVRKALDSGYCTLRSKATVTRVEAGADDRVKAVHYVDANGNARSTGARAVVIACGAVETPRLLLLSENRHAPDGLANESGLVGKHFMETLFWVSSGLHPEALGSHRGHPSDSISWDFNAPDAIPGVVGGCRFSPTTAETNLVGPIQYAQRVAGGWGRSHKARLRKVFGRVLSIGSIGENLPDPGSYVDLDPVERDAAGLPLARIHSHLGESELRRLEFMAGTCREILDAAGIEALFEEYGDYDSFSATHVFGTCRMGTDPRQSVVDRYGRSHRWRNLFVVDASIFPSSGGGESPSLTIEALAIRAADHLEHLMRSKEL
jgi:choline dehydrogenase-like flavoprotein